MDLLRFITAGSVDDGKSTLTGRILYDSRNILADQLEVLEKQTRNRNGDNIDLSLLTDGLRSEREQGITIDVAYKYFSTSARKFISIDAPGHIQYTRNMVTGASNANLIIILIDARNGVIEQSRRHTIIASLLKIPHVVVAVNKMDLVKYSADIFERIVTDYSKVASALNLKDVTYLPVSALKGDNVAARSPHMPWYEGPSLLELLETIPAERNIDLTYNRLPVQYVIRSGTGEFKDYRGYAGKIISGIYRKGDAVSILPLGLTSRIKNISSGGKEVECAFAPQSVVLELEDHIDIGRGDLIVKGDKQPRIEQDLEVLLCWMDAMPLLQGNNYLMQIGCRTVKTIVKKIEYRLNVNTLERDYSPRLIGMNDIVKASIRASSPLPYDPFEDLRVNGGAILIDETSNSTVAACLFK